MNVSSVERRLTEFRSGWDETQLPPEMMYSIEKHGKIAPQIAPKNDAIMWRDGGFMGRDDGNDGERGEMMGRDGGNDGDRWRK